MESMSFPHREALTPATRKAFDQVTPEAGRKKLADLWD